MRAPNVLTISPALPFLETFVAAFLDGEVVPGFAPGTDPLALADATIYVPTRRAAAALREALLRGARAPSLVLPRILPLGALEATETELFLAEPDPVAAGLPLPAGGQPDLAATASGQPHPAMGAGSGWRAPAGRCHRCARYR